MKHGHGEKSAPGKGWPHMKNYPHAMGVQHSMSPARKIAMPMKKMPKKGHAYG